MAGGVHRQLRPKRGKLIDEVGVAEMVRCRGLCDYLKGWLSEATCKKDPERRRWDLVVILL